MAAVWKVRIRVGEYETEGLVGPEQEGTVAISWVFVLYCEGLEMLLGGGWDINR